MPKKKKSYQELLRDPRWQKKRLKVLERDNWLCTSCGDGTTELHIHHKKYLDGKKPWEYRMEMMTTLCTKCHSEVHRKDNIYNKFKDFSDYQLDRMIDFIKFVDNSIPIIDINNAIDLHKSQTAKAKEIQFKSQVPKQKDNDVMSGLDEILAMFDDED